MPDSFNFRRMDDAPQDWGEAFAALPLEAPTRDGWTGVARALDARMPHGRARAARRERRTSWAIGVASAAMLAIVVWAPAARWLQPAQERSGTTAAVDPLPRTSSPAAQAYGPAAPSFVPPDDASASREVTIATATTGEPAVDRERARRATDRLIASLADATSADAMPLTLAAPTTTDSLAALQAQSAQLEALIALARDDRVGSASTAALTSELDGRIAEIDVALSQVDVASEQRVGLWRQRVEALQQLASIKSTERWMAAQGEPYEVALLSVD